MSSRWWRRLVGTEASEEAQRDQTSLPRRFDWVRWAASSFRRTSEGGEMDKHEPEATDDQGMAAWSNHDPDG
jgi:hypothetical protein